MTVVLTYQYRVLPSKAQHAALSSVLESQRQLYNAALEERIEAWRKARKFRSLIDQCKALTECRRQCPEMASLPANLQRGTLKRLDEAFRAFFRRLDRKSGRAGFPRFRGKGSFKSFQFLEFSGITFDGKRLRSKAWPGGLRVHVHRSPPGGKPVMVKFVRDIKGWCVCFVYKMPKPEARLVARAVGIDVGIEKLAALSDGTLIPNPRAAKRAQQKLRRKQRAIARCMRGSKSRQKARIQAAKVHASIRNFRMTYLHQITAHIVDRFDLIAVEKLRVTNLSRSARGTSDNPGTNVSAKRGLNRAILDASWGKLLQFLDYKAERAGVEMVKVSPHGTSQECSSCGAVAQKRLWDRQHKCTACGCVMDRDINAAKNILARAVVGPGVHNVVHQDERALGNLMPKI